MGLQLGIIIYPPSVLQERGFKLVFYDTSDVKIGELGTDVQEGHVSQVSFELDDFGCGPFSFQVDQLPSFNPTCQLRVIFTLISTPFPGSWGSFSTALIRERRGRSNMTEPGITISWTGSP